MNGFETLALDISLREPAMLLAVTHPISDAERYLTIKALKSPLKMHYFVVCVRVETRSAS